MLTCQPVGAAGPDAETHPVGPTMSVDAVARADSRQPTATAASLDVSAVAHSRLPTDPPAVPIRGAVGVAGSYVRARPMDSLTVRL